MSQLKNEHNNTIGKLSDISELSNMSSIKSEPHKVISDDISLSQLEAMANIKKTKKDSIENEISVSQLKSSKSKSSNYSSKPKYSSDTTSESTIQLDKKKARYIAKENKNEEIRRKKSELLYKFNSLNQFRNLSSLRLSMDNSLDEIKNELDRIYNQKTTEDAVVWLKKTMVISAQGLELLNNRFNPINVDLNGWSEHMQYSLDSNDLDETLSELYQKYRYSSSMGPELKLLFYLLSSAGMFAFNKALSNNPEILASLLSSFVNKQQHQQSQQFQQQPPQFQQQPQQFQQVPQQFQQQPQQPQQFRQFQSQQPFIPNAADLNKKFELNESSDDYLPSKMKGLNKDKELNDILNKMDKKQKSESSIDSLIKDVKDINIKKKGRKPTTKKQIIKKT